MISHLYTSLAFALQSNKKNLDASLPKFKALVAQTTRKQFVDNASNIAKIIIFALKTAAKMVNLNKTVYPISKMMKEELDFICQALCKNLGFELETPIAFLIPRMPTSMVFGDSLLVACGGY
jgi:hypothetical protein